MNTYKITRFAENVAAVAVFVIAIIAIIYASIGLTNWIKKDSTPSPVEEKALIDSIQKDNVKIIIEINNLDSIKNVKAIEIKSLDNDSTLSLFYQLIGK